MKSLKFAPVLLSLLLFSTAAAAQLTGSKTDQFFGALKKDDLNTAMQLVGAQPGLANARDEKGEAALVIALHNGDRDLVALLLHSGADANLGSRSGDTPLTAATRIGDSQAVDWLLGLGAKVDGANKSGETPLIVAVQQRNAPLVRLYLARGADPDKADSAAGYSAREYAQRDVRARDIQKLIADARPKPASK